MTRTPNRRAAKIAALVIYIIVILVATPQAQQPVAFSGAPGAMSAGPAATVAESTTVDLLVGRSTILNVGSPIARVSLTVPDVADAMVTAPQQLLIHGKTPGIISLFVWDRAGGIKTYEVSVRRDLTHLVEQMKTLFPGEPITVVGSGKDVIVSGTVTSKYVIDKAAEVASGYVEKKENVVNLLKQLEGQASNQVMLRVRFAEISRSALQELGASFVANGYKSQWYGRTTTGQFPAPEWDNEGRLVFSDFLNLFVLNTRQGLGGVIRALSSKGLFQSLAEPNLIALNGKEASFLAGGEYPYPVVQPGSSGNAITIMFKEFGVRLNFTPTVLGGDLINLKVRPEVSSLDFSNAITLEGFRIPALSTRRTETEVELQDGQTFAIAGLMNNTLNNTMNKIPGIGDIPILGYLFRSRAYQKNQTELVVMITPTIIRRGSTGVSAALPTIVEPYLEAPKKPLPQPDPYVGSPRYPVAGQTTPRPGGGDAPVPQPQAPSAQPQAPQPPSQGNASMPSQPLAMSVPQPPANTTRLPEPPPVVMDSQPEPKPDPKALAREREEQKRAEEQQRKAAETQAEADKKAAEEKAEADRKAAEGQAEADRKAAKEKAEADKKAAAEKARQDKLDAERAKREAEVAKKNQELERKRQAEMKKHEKALAEAAARLKQAQAAYAETEKKKGNQ